MLREPLKQTRIPLSCPDISETEVAEVLGVLRTPWLSLGPKLVEFEERFAAFLGMRHAVAVANGTCGLHLAVRAAGLRPGTEVITTPFSFVAAANVLLFEGLHPVFVDIDPETLNLTPEAVEAVIDRHYIPRGGHLVRRNTGAPLAGLLPVSVFGHPVQMDGFRALARRYRLPIILDSCEALGSQYWSDEGGTWTPEAAVADVAVYAFYPNKQITTGEGGMVVTNDDAIAAYCRMARNQGRRPGAAWLEHAVLGFNYRMDELSAALGVAQMGRISELLAKRAQVAGWYDEVLASVGGVTRPYTAPWARVAWFLYVVRTDPKIDRDAVIDALAHAGIAARAYFPPIHLQLHFRALGYRPGDFGVTEDVASRTVALPYFSRLTRAQVDDVAQTVKEAVSAAEVRT